MAIQIYTQQFAGLLPKVFESEQHFLRTFGNTLQVRDGVGEKDTFMELKVTPTDVVLQNYSTDENVAFGTGTGSTSRFGERKEIVAENVKVPYLNPIVIHEGVDNVTVNANAEAVIAERADLHAEAWTEKLNAIMAEALSTNAGETKTVELTAEALSELFAEAHAHFVDNKVSQSIGHIAYVNPEVYNYLIDNNLANAGKGSTVNIDNQELYRYKGFIVREIASEYFEGDEIAYFAPDNVGVIGLGLNVYRLLDSEDFAGVTIQGLAKPAIYVPEKNKIAIVKATKADGAGV